MAAAYASEPLCDVVLRDGSTLPVRRARQEDLGGLVTFLTGLSPESRYYRFFGVPNLEPASVAGLIPRDDTIGTALVGECAGSIVAFAGYYKEADSPDHAEVAFAIADAFQGRGIGTQLLDRLAQLARAERIRTFDAYVLGTNRKMMEVFRDSGYHVSTRRDGSVCSVEICLEPPVRTHGSFGATEPGTMRA